MRVRDTSKAQLLDAGLVLLSSEAVGGVQKLLSPEALQEMTRESNADGVSRHTAYRLWEDRGEAVVDLARHVTDMNIDGSRAVFALVLAATVDALTRIADEGRLVVDIDKATMQAGLRDLNRGVFENQLGASQVAATWTLNGAALTSSRLWQGRRPDDELARVGHEVLVARGRFYAEVREVWNRTYDGLLSWWGRRIRPDHRVEVLTDLVLALFDGLTLQIFVDPALNDPDDSPDGERRRRQLARQKIDDASDGIFELIWAYSEPAIDDPRRDHAVAQAGTGAGLRHGAGEDVGALFDRVVAAATEPEVGEGTEMSSVVEVADRAGVEGSLAAALFPSAGDLADSVLRRLVAPAGLELGLAEDMNPVPLIELVLRRVRRVATERPGLVATARARPPTHPEGARSFVAELAEAIGTALGSPTVNCPKPAQTADLLIDLTLDREDRWANVETLLSVLGAAGGAPARG
jgi:hypothetical protein